MKIAFIFSGQGSQYIGMGKEIYENFETAKNVFDKANDILDFDLKELVWYGDKEKLNITENTQPAILTTSVAILEVLKEKGITSDVNLGLSLGEYSSLVASGALDFETAVALVRKRGKYMQEAVPIGVGKMVAVIGLSLEKIEEAVEKAREKGVVEIANYNTRNQIVIGGQGLAIDYAKELLNEAGARRVIELKVSGPFHTSLLDPAAEKLEKELEKVNFKDLKVKVVSNVTGEYISNKDEIKSLLKKQVKSSVKWYQSIEMLIDDGFDTFIEIGPLKTLTSFVREISKQKGIKVNAFNVEDIKTLNKTLEGLGSLC